jgi:hypothetical protein
MELTALRLATTTRSNTMSDIQIAKSPSYPWFSVLVDGLWDCDCASNNEAATIVAAKEKYNTKSIVMWDDPTHYSNR